MVNTKVHIYILCYFIFYIDNSFIDLVPAVPVVTLSPSTSVHDRYKQAGKKLKNFLANEMADNQMVQQISTYQHEQQIQSPLVHTKAN